MNESILVVLLFVCLWSKYSTDHLMRLEYSQLYNIPFINILFKVNKWGVG